MGISYRPVLYVGKYFDEDCEAVDWLKDNGYVFTDEQVAMIEDEECLEDVLYYDSRIKGQRMNYYAGHGLCLGFDVQVSVPELFEIRYNEAMESWIHLFPDVVPDLIHDVVVS